MLTYAKHTATYIAAALNCKRGATAIEYGLIAAGISVAIVSILATMGSHLNTKFTAISTALQ